jgi:DNA-binding HxlR family transcriptional regulator
MLTLPCKVLAICYIYATAMKTAHTSCPITKVAQLLSDTWTMLIMHFLIKGPMGFCELERALDGISTRTLTLKLRKLMEDGLIKKTKEGTYTTTDKGKGIRLVENAMKRYEEKYL